MQQHRLSGISGQLGTGELAVRAQLLASDRHPPPGPVDDVLDSLCTVHGGGDLHGHLYFLVCMQKVYGQWGGERPLSAWTPG